MPETWVWSLDQEDPLEKGMATHSSFLAWRIAWIEEPGGLQPKRSQRVRHDWVTFSFCNSRIQAVFTFPPYSYKSLIPLEILSPSLSWSSVHDSHQLVPGHICTWSMYTVLQWFWQDPCEHWVLLPEPRKSWFQNSYHPLRGLSATALERPYPGVSSTMLTSLISRVTNTFTHTTYMHAYTHVHIHTHAHTQKNKGI